jgi:flagellar basal-body rod protein FlgB
MDETPILLKKLMDSCAVRHSVLANNLANVNTPGFKRSDVDFRKTLAEAVKAGDVAKLASAQPQIKTDHDAKPNDTGNSVSTQTEIGMMTDNGLLYSLSVRVMSEKFAEVRKAIRGN